MTILGASVLFTRGANTHDQLRVILSEIKDPKYEDWLKDINSIFASENTRANREKLQSFLIEKGEEIYRVYSRFQNEHGVNNFGYGLK